MISASQNITSWMRPFSAVLVEDGSTISLPSTLASVWRGYGGTKPSADKPGQSEATLKLTVRYDLKGGTLNDPHRSLPAVSEVLREQVPPAGAGIVPTVVTGPSA